MYLRLSGSTRVEHPRNPFRSSLTNWRATAPQRRACGTDFFGRRWCWELQVWFDIEQPEGDRCPGCGRGTWGVLGRLERRELVAA